MLNTLIHSLDYYEYPENILSSKISKALVSVFLENFKEMFSWKATCLYYISTAGLYLYYLTLYQGISREWVMCKKDNWIH